MGATLSSVWQQGPFQSGVIFCFFCGFRGWQSQNFWPSNRLSKTINPGSETWVQNLWRAGPGKIFCAVKWDRKGPLEQRPGVNRGLANSMQHLFGIKSASDSGEPGSPQHQSPLQSLMRRNYWFMREVFPKLKDANVNIGRACFWLKSITFGCSCLENDEQVVTTSVQPEARRATSWSYAMGGVLS